MRIGETKEFAPVTALWKVYDDGFGIEDAVKKAREIARARPGEPPARGSIRERCLKRWRKRYA